MDPAESAGMMSDRFENEKYVNWLKVSLALIYAKEGLERFTDTEVQNFHRHVSTLVPTAASPLTSVQTCCVCLKKDIKKQWHRNTFKCTANICDRWIRTILSYHMSPRPLVEWDNADISQLPISAWECTKLFMSFGCQNSFSVEEFDFASLLTLYIKCRHFHGFIQHRFLCEQVREIRNKTMHSGQMEIETSQMQMDVPTILRLLQDPKHFNADSDCQDAVRKIQELMAGTLELSLNKELELRIINNTIQDINNKVSNLRHQHETMSNEILTLTADVGVVKAEQTDNLKMKSEMEKVKQDIEKVMGKRKRQTREQIRKKQKCSFVTDAHVGEYVWAKVKGAEVLWPVQILAVDVKVLVYIKCDNAEVTIEKKNVDSLFPGDLEVIKKTAIEESIVWAYDSLKKAGEEASLKAPELITSTNLRKYMATMTQVLDLKSNEFEWVLNHLGHTMDVHKLHYRATSDILERTQVAKLLMLQDQGRIGEFQNQSLEEIHFEDVVQEDTEDTDPDQGQVDIEEDSHLEEALDESQTFFSELEGKRRKRKAEDTRKTWSTDEEEEIKALFKKFFDSKKRPTQKDCLKAKKRSKRENELIHERKKDVLKKKVFRMIDKLNA